MDTLDHIFGSMDNWSTCDTTLGEGQIVVRKREAIAEGGDQGLPARSTGSSRFGSDFLATSASRAAGSRRRNF